MVFPEEFKNKVLRRYKVDENETNEIILEIQKFNHCYFQIAMENGQNSVGELLRQAAERKIPLLDIITAYHDKDYLEVLYQRALECLKDKELYDEWCALYNAYYSGDDQNTPRAKK